MYRRALDVMVKWNSSLGQMTKDAEGLSAGQPHGLNNASCGGVISILYTALLLMVFLSGCGGTYDRSPLKIVYTPQKIAGFAANGEAMRLTMVDQRSRPDSIGGIAYAAGINRGEHSAQPVGDLVRNAVIRHLTETGFEFSPEAADALEVCIKRFWIEWPVGFNVTVTAEVNLTARMIRSGKTVWSSQKSGRSDSHRHAGGMVNVRLREDLLSQALSATVHGLFDAGKCRIIAAVLRGEGPSSQANTEHATAFPVNDVPCDLSGLPESAIAPSLAVLDLHVASDLNASDGEVLADMCRIAVLNSQRFTLVEREAMKALLDEEDLSKSIQCDDTRCLVNYGQKLRAQKIVYGKLNRLGQSFTVTLTMVDVASAEVVAMETGRVSETIEALMELIGPMTCRLLKTALEKNKRKFGR